MGDLRVGVALLRSVIVRLDSSSSADHAESTTLRLTFLSLLVVSLFVLIFARLWYLQIMSGDTYEAQAVGNRVDAIALEAPRGSILDADGEPIVRNRYAPVVSIMPREVPEDRKDEIFAILSEMLALTPEEIERRAESTRAGEFRPRPVAVDVPDDVIAYIHENGHAEFPGVYAETLPLREYPNDDRAAHLLGYLREIGEDELSQERYADYRMGEQIGQGGLEQAYESVLRGQDGRRRLEVDATGSVLRELDQEDPVRGSDVRLTLDLEAQAVVEEALEEGIRNARQQPDDGVGEGRGGSFRAPAGAAVVLDIANQSSVVAMASFPTFDPGAFVGGISDAGYAGLIDEGAGIPLLNRAIQSSYPPGSVYKVVSAAAALEDGYLGPGEAVDCPGEWTWPATESTYRNWDPTDNGFLTMPEALRDSCNTVFFQLARLMFNDEVNALRAVGDEPPTEEELQALHEPLADMSRAWGLGAETQVDLTGERQGIVPGRVWKRDYWESTRRSTCQQAAEVDDGSRRALLSELCNDGYRWRGGDAVNMSVGQGDLQTTPLQIANAYAALANGGTLYSPRVASEVIGPDGEVTPLEAEVLGELPVSPANLDAIRQGLLAVTAEGGTAAEVFDAPDFPIRIAGKTGTAEYKPKQPIAWFAGYGPAEDPRYAVVAMVEEGGSGSQNAAPIVKRIFQGLLPGLEETEIEAGAVAD